MRFGSGDLALFALLLVGPAAVEAQPRTDPVAQARQLVRDGHPAAALAQFQSLLRIRPADAELLAEAGWAALLAGRLAEARALEERAFQHARDDRVRAAILYNLGRLAEARNDLTGAACLYRQSLLFRETVAVRERLASLSVPDAQRTCPATMEVVGPARDYRELLVTSWETHSKRPPLRPERAAKARTLSRDGSGREAFVLPDRFGGNDIEGSTWFVATRDRRGFHRLVDLGLESELVRGDLPWGTSAFEVSELAFQQLVPGGPEELRVEFTQSSVPGDDEGGDGSERGSANRRVAICGDLDSEPVCTLIGTRTATVEHKSDGTTLEQVTGEARVQVDVHGILTVEPVRGRVELPVLLRGSQQLANVLRRTAAFVTRRRIQGASGERGNSARGLRLQWARAVGNCQRVVTASTSTGGLFVACRIWAPVDFGGGLLTPRQGGGTVLASLTVQGQHRWSKLLPPLDVSAMAANSQGELVVAGTYDKPADLGGGTLACFRPGSPGSCRHETVFVAAYGPDGEHRWSRRLWTWTGHDDHWWAEPVVRGLAQNARGEVLLAGTFGDRLDGAEGSSDSAGGRDIFVSSLSATGRPRWTKLVGGPAEEEAVGLLLAPNGEALVLGTFGGRIDAAGIRLRARGQRDLFIARFGPDGAARGAIAHGTPGAAVGLYAAALADNGELVLAGGSGASSVDFGGGPLRDHWIVRLSATGQHRWSRASVRAVSLAAMAGGETVLAADLDERSNDLGRGAVSTHGEADIALVRLNSQGQPRWTRRFGGPGTDRATFVGAAGRTIVLAGVFEASIELGGTTLDSETGASLPFIASFHDR